MALFSMDLTDWFQSIVVGDLVVVHGILSVFDSHENFGCLGLSVESVFVVDGHGSVSGKLAMSL